MPAPERIAYLRQRRHILVEQPFYFQFAFGLDRVKALVPQASRVEDRSNRSKQSCDGDIKTRAAAGERGLVELMMAAHAGMTTDRERSRVEWLAYGPRIPI